jgi:predicted RND superfamily exporter protein
MKADWFSFRTAVAVLMLTAFAVPLTIKGVREAVRSNANDVRDWLPGHYPETTQYRWFRQHFGNEDFVVVSWPGGTLDDGRLDQFAQALRERDAAYRATGQTPIVERVVTGGQLIDQCPAEPIGLSPQEAVHRLQGTIVGPDGQQTAVVVTLAEEARLQLKSTVYEIKHLAASIGLPESDIHVGGPPVVNAAIDQSSTQSLVRLAGLAALIGLVVAWLCFRTVRLTIIVFVVAGFSATASLAVVPLFGVPMNAILVTMVPLVYVAAMSGAIHLTNYYLDELRAGKPHAITGALKHAALPLGLATGTTAIGLLSLEYSDLMPIRMFGLFSAIGIVIALALQFALLPALLVFWPGPAPTKEDAEAGDGTQPLPPMFESLARFVIGRQAWFSTAMIIVLAVGGWGLTRMETSIQIMRLFSPDTPIIASYGWLEEKLGALTPMEVVLRFPKDDKQTLAQRLQLVRKVQEEIGALDDVGGSLSAATFAPSIKVGKGASLRSFMTNRRLEKARPKLENSGYLAGDGGEEYWRISVRVNAVKDIDYGLFQHQLEGKVQPVLAETKSAGGGQVTAVYTGAVPIIYKARRSLLDGLMLGFGTDVALIFLAMVIATRNLSSGILLFLASVFPMTLVFGLMGLCGIVIDIGSVMTPCVALGVTVDDVIHFVLWYRRGIQRGLSVQDSVLLAYEGCGRAMIQSWGVIGLGLSAFALSSFIPTFRFGALMIALLTAGLAGNLIFLPALLAGPLGRWIASPLVRRREAERLLSGGRMLTIDPADDAPVRPNPSATRSRQATHSR